jgi:hypothetical protein
MLHNPIDPQLNPVAEHLDRRQILKEAGILDRCAKQSAWTNESPNASKMPESGTGSLRPGKMIDRVLRSSVLPTSIEHA